MASCRICGGRDSCSCRCSGCGHRFKNCTCRDPRDVELRPRPSRRAEEPPRVSSVPSTVRVGSSSRTSQPSSARVSSSASAPRVSSSSARVSSSRPSSGAPSSTPSSYRNVAYADRTDPVYNNTGPPYDSATNVLSAQHRRIADDTRASGQDDLAERFERQARLSNKHSGNHSDQPTYGRESLYRTASDMEDHDVYKRGQKNLERARRDYPEASQEAPRMQKHTDPTKHLRVADIHQDIGDSHRTIADGRLGYMEAHPGGLADANSFRTHVTAAGDGLVGMNRAYVDRDRERATATKKQLDQQSGAWGQDSRAGNPYLDRPESSSTLHSSNSSKVSSSKSAKPFSSGSKVKRQCRATRSSGRPCTNLTGDPSGYCRDHR